MVVFGIFLGSVFLLLGFYFLFLPRREGVFRTSGSLLFLMGIIFFLLTIFMIFVGLGGLVGVLLLTALLIVLSTGSGAWIYLSAKFPFETRRTGLGAIPLIPSIFFLLLSIPLAIWGWMRLKPPLTNPVTGGEWMGKGGVILSFAGMELILFLLSFFLLLFIARGYLLPSAHHALLLLIPNITLPAHILLILFFIESLWYNLYGSHILSMGIFLSLLFFMGIMLPLIGLGYLALKSLRGGRDG